MPEMSFRSPNFYEREIDLSAPFTGGPTGTPAGVIGTAPKGPAFVPITVARFTGEFDSTLGDLDPRKPGTYAANEFLRHRSALTYLRVLGAGANATETDIMTTLREGRVLNAGFHLDGRAAPGDTQGRHVGAVQFLVARHALQTDEAFGVPMFTDNDSFTGGFAHLVRGVLMTTSGSRVQVLNGTESAVGSIVAGLDDTASIEAGRFKLIISTSLGAAFGTADGNPGVRILSASMDPSSADYFAKVLNTDPERFDAEQHLLYADFAVDAELASAVAVAVVSGSSRTSTSSGDTALTMREAFGAFDTRYTCATSPWFISQPFGTTEHDLFRFESLDDGESTPYKISVTNLKASSDESKPHGSFTIQVRDWSDTDANAQVIEQFNNCSLDPNSSDYIAKLIGDRRVTYNFDAVVADERRIVARGKYPNRSRHVRVIVSDAVARGLVPKKALPFGFRGIETLKTNDSLTDTAGLSPRIVGVLGVSSGSSLSGSIVPPLPLRYKVTKGPIPSSSSWSGQPGPLETASPLLYWGVKFERNTNPLNANVTSERNGIINAFVKFGGIRKLDVLVTGSGADALNNNKFTLARVALSNAAIADLTASVGEHMKEAAYLRRARLDPSDYRATDPVLSKRVTFATILASGTPADFNRFSQYAKFSAFLCGGFDGVNILDRIERRMGDAATSFDAGGCAEASYVSPGFTTNMAGAGQSNNAVASYKTAIDIMTDPLAVSTNVLTLPGIREPFLTDYAAKRSQEYGMALYIMDVPSYNDDAVRLYDDATERPDVESTCIAFEGRVIDNSYVATYFPDVSFDDAKNKRRVKVPASVSALGAIGYNDRISFPWFAPAGFNRAALDSVKNVRVRLNVSDRDRLQDARINPIATFPREGYVIYGQKTLQVAKSALDRVNVRRLLIEVKHLIVSLARGLIFENNTAGLRAQFKADADLRLAVVQSRQGVERFSVTMDASNNTEEDEQANRINGRIAIVPTKTIEAIGIDFVITSSGVQFL
jgi:hypothetical protein